MRSIRLVASVVGGLLFAVSLYGFRNRSVPIPTSPAEPSEHDFDRLLGTWSFTSSTKNPKIPPVVSGVWTWQRTGLGSIVEDDYRVLDPQGNERYLGVTLRAYDATTKRWANAFVEPPRARWRLGEAWRDGDDIREGPADSTRLSRARFSNISADHFTWTFDVSKDGGKTWINEWVRAEAKRVAPASASR